MQHYGASTRLLDWTASPYIAVYYAVVEQWDRDGAVWYFDQNQLTDELAKEFASVNWRTLSSESKVFAFYPQRPTDRMLAQKGSFTVSLSGLTSHNAGLESYGLNKVVIPAGEKPQILRFLLSMNVSGNVVFPGLDGMGRELKTRLKVLLMND